MARVFSNWCACYACSIHYIGPYVTAPRPKVGMRRHAGDKRMRTNERKNVPSYWFRESVCLCRSRWIWHTCMRDCLFICMLCPDVQCCVSLCVCMYVHWMCIVLVCASQFHTVFFLYLVGFCWWSRFFITYLFTSFKYTQFYMHAFCHITEP